MRCPICKKELQAAENAFRPFCSERCKLIDLGNWLSERYRIPEPADSPQFPAGADQDADDRTTGERD